MLGSPPVCAGRTPGRTRSDGIEPVPGEYVSQSIGDTVDPLDSNHAYPHVRDMGVGPGSPTNI